MDRTSPGASTSALEPESEPAWQPVTIVTCYYLVTLGPPATRASRQAEYETALRANLSHPRVESVVLFVRGPDARARLATLNLPHREKLVELHWDTQPKQKDYFRYCNESLAGKLCFILCADDLLDDDFAVLDGELRSDDPQEVYALTRHEDDGTCPLIDDFQGSHDGFLFRSPLTQIDLEAFDFFQFNPGSDNVILEHLYARGYQLSNPCRRLKIIHLHRTKHREGDQTRVNDSFHWLEIPPLD
jgi:hypothetical protein